MIPKEYKLIFTGTMGAGKTTAIAAISEIAPVRTDVASSETVRDGKTTTTAALDYGEVTLPQGDVLRLYGTPGQGRFSFMWNILGEGALGVIVLVDNRRPDPVADLCEYLEAFRDTVAGSRAVIGVGRRDTHPLPDLDAYYAATARLGLQAPIVSVDVRSREDVLLLLDILFNQIEAGEEALS
jgi:signal recognition particle receptor subunit beta